ncbi:hypothetical protein BC332_25801 [Capsicum chinense]|nr:hypothetical protein BC332_25801 [Capsicum chinense]
MGSNKKKKVEDEDLNALWSRGISFKFSFLAWRTWNGLIPDTALLHSWNTKISRACVCCENPRREIISHLFLRGEIADKVLEHYCAATVSSSNRRCCLGIIKWFKGNTDGALKENLGPRSIPFCIRDQHGNLLVAQGNKIRDTTSLEAKAMAIRACPTYCRRNSISQLILESDSRTTVQILNTQWEIPWSLAVLVKSIKALMESMSVRVIHSHKEGNTLVDFLTYLVFTYAGFDLDLNLNSRALELVLEYCGLDLES